ncbi:MAG: chemotaxis protein CheW [Sphingomonas sp.]|nr:chemotaxis protein CheW [Sphingomonas sp.]MDX3884566.1 chemotaxis protein CheW [Sphingomonas sp.]
MMRQLITFRIGAQSLAVDIMATREIRAWSPTTPLPHAAGFVRGVLDLRGIVLPVIDLSARLGWGDCDPTPRHVVMVMQIGDRPYGLIVDAVSDIATIDSTDVQAPPELGRDGDHDLVKGIVTIEGEMVMILDLDRLAGDCPLPEETPLAA